jgi:hypothetical protein
MMRALLILTVASVAAMAVALRRRSLGSSVVSELTKRSHLADYEHHSHEGTVHSHQHPHVTHNRREGMDEVIGEWEHLTSLHGHEHNHSALDHRHLPHEDAAHEHLGEAHIHDHSHPTAS